MNTKLRSIVVVSICMAIFWAGPAVYGAQNRVIDQTKRLDALSKVWGLLKYFHPEVGKGGIDWDAALTAAIPAVKAAEDYDSFNQEIDNLIVLAGDVTIEEYNPQTPAHPNEALFKWIKDSSLFNNDVRKKLTLVQKKHVPAENHYVQETLAGNVFLGNEAPYYTPYYPDENYRLLGLFRYWNIIQYFFPYKEDIGRDWQEVQVEFIPRFIEASDAFEYGLAVKELTTRINDGHAFTGGGYLEYYFGYYSAPIEIRFIENQTIVTRVFAALLDSPDDVQVGDIIVKTHNQDITDFRGGIRKYANGSNEPNIETNINDFVLRWNSNRVPFTLLRDGRRIDVTVPGYLIYEDTISNAKEAEDSLLPHWKILPGNIGYVNMGLLEPTDVDTAMAELKNTRAIIFDIRNYPLGTMYDISNYLNPRPEKFVKFTVPDLDYPGDFYFTEQTYTGTYNPDYYRGKVILLHDEQTMSQAEFTCMVLETAPDVTKIGSQTAGSDGNVSWLHFPGAIYTYFSGLGVYYPDGTSTQRIGIVPDIEVHPTVTGIQNGRDDVLEFAIRFIEDN